MPSQYLLAAPVLGIIWPSMAVALWWGAACAVLLPRTANDPPDRRAPADQERTDLAPARGGGLRLERRDDAANG